MVKSVDTRDLKSFGSNAVRVQVSLWGLSHQESQNSFPVSVFMLYYMQVGHQAEQGRVPAEEPEADLRHFCRHHQDTDAFMAFGLSMIPIEMF